MTSSAILDNSIPNETPAAPESAHPKVGFVSLGCPKNLVDSEVMMGMLHHGGAELTPRAEDADVLVVNTCSFIDSAKQESVDTILEMVQHKVANGGHAKRLIVAGCLVERYRDEIRKNIPEVDAVIGTGELDAILEAVGLTRPLPAPVTNSPFTVLTSTQVAAIEAKRNVSGRTDGTGVNADTDGEAGVNEKDGITGVEGGFSPLSQVGVAPGFSPGTHAPQIRRAPSAVNQHSRPESNDTQLRHELSATYPLDPNPSPSTPSTLGPVPSPSRAEGDAREAAGRFSREAWDGARAELPSYLYSDQTPRIRTTPRASAYIKIAEGCDHPCSFCIIPQLRGKFRSRPIESIVAEAKSLIAQGVREITLIGQDTTCYGEDLPPQSWREGTRSHPPDAQSRPELADLLDALAPLPGLKWLRFLYAYPNKITTRLLETIARHDNIAKYLDVPLQHASANVLKRMRRGGTSARFLQIIDKARKTVPGLVLRTSFIVGFPGETDQDFEELCAFVQAAKIDWLGVFSYSDEEGAKAFDLGEKVPGRTIEARRRKLMRLQNKISRAAKKQWVGRKVEVLVEGPSEETELLWQGRTLDQAPEIDGKVLINDFGPHDELVPGTFYRAEITESHDYDVVARIIE